MSEGVETEGLEREEDRLGVGWVGRVEDREELEKVDGGIDREGLDREGLLVDRED
jgi:hypothetical protein